MMLCTPPTFFSFLGLLALLSSCKADSHGNLQHHLRRQQGTAGERRNRHWLRDDVVAVVTETVYETTYLGYTEGSTQTADFTVTSTIYETVTGSPESAVPSVVIVYSSVFVLPVPANSSVTNTFSTSTSTSTTKPASSTSSTMIISTRQLATSTTAALSTTLLTSTRTPTSTATPSPTTPYINTAYSAVAKAAISALQPFYSTSNYQWTDVRGWIAANAYNDIMDMDMYTNSKVFESTYGASLLTIATDTNAQNLVLSTDSFNDDQLWWCLAMIRAYQNYGHKELLTQSIKQWRAIGANSQVFKSDQGTTPTKGGLARSVAIESTCDVDGAVYWTIEAASTLNAISTGLYAQVGAWLLQETGDASFRGPTDSALGWLERMMLNPDTGIMNIDSYDMHGCAKGFGSLTYNTGVFVGALSTMFLVTGEQKYLTQAQQSVNSSVTGSFGSDTSADPLIIVQQNDLTANGDAVQWRDVLFRNLADFYVNVGAKGDVSSDLRAKGQAFFKANYDQIQSKAKFGELYAPNWFGLMNSGSDFGTVSVLSCLTGAMLLL